MLSIMKHWRTICAILLAAVVLCSCERSASDARKPFIGDYTFVSTGNIDLYAGSVKVITVPMDKDGEMSITPADKDNTVWIIAENDSLLAYVSGTEMFMDPTTDSTTIGGILMQMSFTYGRATLTDNQLSWKTDVEITATYRSMSLRGTGQVDIVATKQSN